MKNCRHILLHLNKIHRGNWDKIYKSIVKKTDIPDDNEINDTVEHMNQSYVSIVDDDYPVKLKNQFKPPFILSYIGDLNMLNRDDIIYIHHSNIADVMSNLILPDILKSNILISGLDTEADREILKIAMKNEKSFILVVNESINELDYDEDEVLYYALHHNCLILSEFAFDSDNKDYSRTMKHRLIAPFLSGLLIGSAKRGDVGISLLAEAVITGNGQVYCLPEKPFENSLNNQLIKDGAMLVDSADDIIQFIKQ